MLHVADPVHTCARTRFARNLLVSTSLVAAIAAVPVQAQTFDIGGGELVVDDLSALPIDNATVITNGTLTVDTAAVLPPYTGTLNDSLGPLSLNKAGTGTLTLSGANTYTGNTLVSAGTLRVASSDALGSSAGGTTVSSGASLLITGSSSATRNITDALTISGTGQGGIGAIRVEPDANPGFQGVNLAGGVTLTADATITNTDRMLLSFTGSGIQLGGSTLTFNSEETGNSTTRVGVGISGTGGLIKNGPGLLDLAGTNLFTGPVTLNGGDISLRNGAALADSVAVTVADGAVLGVSGTETIGSLAGSGRVILTSGVTLTTGTNNTSTIYAGTGPNSIVGSGNLAKTGTGTFTLTGNNGYTGTTTISGGTLQIGNGGTTGTLGSGEVINNGALVFDRSDVFTVGNVISGSGTLTKQGAGNLTLSGANTYSGVTTVSGGTLTITAGGALGNTVGGTTVADGATLAFGTGATIAEAINFRGTGAGGVGALNALASVNLDGNMVLEADGSVSVQNLQLIRFRGATFGALGNAVLTLNTLGNSTIFLNSALSGIGGLIKNGTGQVQLAGKNTFTGPVTINAGVLQVTGGSAIEDSVAITGVGLGRFSLDASETIGSIAGEGSIALFNNSTLTTGGNNSNTSYSGQILSTGSLVKTGTGTFTLTGNNGYTGTTTISGGTLQIGNGGTTGTLGGGEVINNGALVFDRSDVFTVGNVISGSGTLTMQGTGTLTLSGNNTIDGGITVAGGTLRLASNNAAGGAAGRITTTGSVIDYANGVTMATPITLNSNTTQLQVLTGSATQSGVISETGGARPLEKIGAGELVLTSNPSFTGDLTITEGTLTVRTSTTCCSLGEIDVIVGSSNTLNEATFKVGGFAFVRSLSGGAAADKMTVTIEEYLAVTGDVDTTYSGKGTGAGQLNVQGGGSLNLTGDWSGFTGQMFGSNGALSLTGDAVTGASVVGADFLGTFTTDGGALSRNALVFYRGSESQPSLVEFTGSETVAFLGGARRESVLRLTGTGTVLTLTGEYDAIPSYLNRGGISGQGSLVIEGGAHTFRGLYDYTGSTTINGGSLTLLDTPGFFTATLASSVVSIGEDGTLVLDGGTFTANPAITNNGLLTISGNETIGSLAGAGTLTLNALLTTGGNNTSTTVDGAITGTGGLVKTGTGTFTVTGNLDLDGAIGVNGGTLALSGNNTIDGGITVAGGTLRLASNNAAGGAAGRITTTGSVIDYADGVTMATPITLNSNTTQLQVLTGSATQSGVISETGGARPLEKIGAGTLSLTEANTFTGDLTVTEGTLRLAATGRALDSAVDLVIGSAGTVTSATVDVDSRIFINSLASGADPDAVGLMLDLDDADLVIIGAVDSTYAGAYSGAEGALVNNGSGVLTLTGDGSAFSNFILAGTPNAEIAITGDGVTGAQSLIALNDGKFSTDGGALLDNAKLVLRLGGTMEFTGSETVGTIANELGTGSSSGIITLEGAGTTLTLTGKTSRFNATGFSGLSGSIAGSGNLALTGGVHTFTGANTYSGSTTLSNGATMQLARSGSLASTYIELVGSGGTLQTDGGALANTAAVNNSGLFRITGNETIGSVGGSGNIVLEGDLTTGGSNASSTISGIISGSRSLTKQGTGTLTLTGANTYTGATAVNAGVLALTGSGSLASTTLSTGSGGTLRTDGGALANTAVVNNSGLFRITGNETIGSIFGSGGLQLDAALATGRDNTSRTLSGAVSGSGSLVKQGTGTLSLTGGMVLGGAVTVEAGTLALRGTNQAGPVIVDGTLRLENGGTLSGSTGTIATIAGTSGTAVVTGAGSNWASTGDLEVGNGGTGTLTISSGGRVSNRFARVGDAASATGTVLVTGEGSLWANALNIELGTLGTGRLTVESGGAVTSNAGFLGFRAGSNATALVTGAGSSWTNTNEMFVGYSSTANLTISGGGLVSNSFGVIGDGAGSNGTVTVTGAGSRWTNAVNIELGARGTGSLTVESGGAVTSNAGFVGYLGGSSGTVLVTGARSSWTNTNELFLGHSSSGSMTISAGGTVSNTLGSIAAFAGSTGTATVTGAGSRWTNTSRLLVGSTGTGSLTISAGGLVTSNTGLVGNRAGSSGTLSVTGAGSRLEVQGFFSVGEAGSGSMTIAAGGVVTSPEGDVAFASGSNGTVLVTGAGSNWDNSTFLRVGRAGTGVLTITNGGTVTTPLLNIAALTSGRSTVNIGAAAGDAAAAAGTLAASAITFGGGTGLLVFNHTAPDLLLAATMSGNGSIRHLAGTTRLTGDLNLGGSIALDGGTLVLSGNNLIAGGIFVDDATLRLASNNAAGGAAGRITTTGSVIDYADGVNSATPITLASNTTQLRVLTGSATQSGAISETGGARPLEKIGAGSLSLTAPSTFTGNLTVSAGRLVLVDTSIAGNVINAATFNTTGNAVIAGNFANSGTARFDVLGSTQRVGGTYSNSGNATLAFTYNTDTLAAGLFDIGGTATGNTAVQIATSGPVLRFSATPKVLVETGGGSGTFTLTGTPLPGNALVNYTFGQLAPTQWGITSYFNYGAFSGLAGMLQSTRVGLATGFHQTVSDSLAQAGRNERSSGVWLRVAHGQHDDSRFVSSTFGSARSEIDTSFIGIEGGIDTTLAAGEGWALRGGVMAGRADGSASSITTYTGFTGTSAASMDTKVTFAGLYGVFTSGALTIDLDYRHEWHDLAISAAASGPGGSIGLLSGAETDGEADVVQGRMTYVFRAGSVHARPLAGITWQRTTTDTLAFPIASAGAASLSFDASELLLGNAGMEIGADFDIGNQTVATPYLASTAWMALSESGTTTATVGGQTSVIDPARAGTFGETRLGLRFAPESGRGFGADLSGSVRYGGGVTGYAVNAGVRFGF